MKERFLSILNEIKKGLHEKDAELQMALLTAIAGESILLLGPPGVAKSMIARRIKYAFENAKSFEYLMSRFSTPDEIFGPVCISKLKESDVYERNTEGFLPDADVAFLDEIWKAGPAILNTLLTILNEKTFKNGKNEIHVPLKLLVGASNELPAEGEGLEALWDRFLVRMVSECVKSEENFYQILMDESSSCMEPDLKTVPSITHKEYKSWQKQISLVDIRPEVLSAITYIRNGIKNLRLDENNDSVSRVHNIYISDRRWKHIVHLLRASAFVHDRKEVDVTDLVMLVYCLWNEIEEIDALRLLIIKAIFVSCMNVLKDMNTSLTKDLKGVNASRAILRAREENYHRDDNKEIFDNFYYLIDNFATGNTYIFFVDYKNLKDFIRGETPQEGVIYPDPNNPKRTLVSLMNDSMDFVRNKVAAMTVKLYRSDNNIYINGVQYPIHLLPHGQKQDPFIKFNHKIQPSMDYEHVVETLSAEVREIVSSLNSNLFASPDDKVIIEEQQKVINQQIAHTRCNIQDLLYGE